MMTSIFEIQLSWLTKAQGGRSTPIRIGRYTPTARFAGESEQFSVVLENPGDDVNPTKATLRLLFPDSMEIQRRIHPGVAIEIMEGARVVAQSVVLEIYEGIAAS